MLSEGTHDATDDELEYAAVALETLLRHRFRSYGPALLASVQQLQSGMPPRTNFQGIPKFLSETKALSSYVEQAKAGDDIDPALVLALVKADVVRRRRKQPPQKGDEKSSLKTLLFTILGGVIIAAATSFLNTKQEINARRAGEIYSGRRQFLQETINKLSEFQGKIEKLHNEIRGSESKPAGLTAGDAVFHSEDLAHLQTEFRDIIGALQATPRSDLRFAELHAHYELEALAVCLGTASAAAKDDRAGAANSAHKTTEDLRTDIVLSGKSDLTPDQVSKILRDADTTAPCGEKFLPQTLEELTYYVAKQMWNLE